MGISALDWVILLSTLLFIVSYGVWKTRFAVSGTDFISGGNEARWFTVGLSVMATQASAITFLSTPGQAFHDGMGFVQFYFGLPLAMVVICMFFLPTLKKSKVLTAYEYLENRFDNKTRLFTAILFLIQRGLGAGLTIYAPSIILSTIFGWDLNLLNIMIGVLVTIYTVTGGTKAVNVTHKQQMFVIMAGMAFTFFTILNMLPDHINLPEAIQIAAASGKMEIVDFTFNTDLKYTFWSGITGGFFLSLAYFGTDQSQVQRYLSAESEEQSRIGLIMNGLLKIPLQFFILLCGVLVFVFFQFNQSPIFFNPSVMEKLEQSSEKDKIFQLESDYVEVFNARQMLIADPSMDIKSVESELATLNAQERKLRSEVKEVINKALPGEESNDKDYVFISFILNFLPTGLIGLLLAVIFSAAMSSTASELNALSTTTTIDIYKRNIKPDLDEKGFVKSTKLFTLLWGAIAISFACYGTLFENLIQFVNIVGSIFYGTILGIFLVGFFFKQVKANAVFYSAVITQVMIIVIYKADVIGYLWLNAIGSLGVVVLSIIANLFISSKTDFSND